MGGGGVLVAWGARGASRLWQCVVAYLAVSSALWTAVHLRVGEGNPAFWSTVGAVIPFKPLHHGCTQANSQKGDIFQRVRCFGPRILRMVNAEPTHLIKKMDRNPLLP